MVDATSYPCLALLGTLLLDGCSNSDPAEPRSPQSGPTISKAERSIFVPCSGTKTFSRDGAGATGPELGTSRFNRAHDGVPQHVIGGVDYQHNFYVSNAVQAVRFVATTTAQFDVDGWDRFSITDSEGNPSYFVPQETPYYMPRATAWFDVAESGRLTLGTETWINGAPGQQRGLGVDIDQIVVQCNPDGLPATPRVQTIYLNEEVDGLLATTGDKIYFRVERSAEERARGGHVVIVLKHLTAQSSANDFDLYGRWGSTPPSETSYDFRLYNSSYACPAPAPCDEATRFLTWQAGDTEPLSLMVTSYSGEGQFRLYVHQPTCLPPRDGWSYGYGMGVTAADFTATQAEKDTIKKILRRFAEYTMGSFDGMQHIDTFDFHDNLDDCHDCIKFYKFEDNCERWACVKGVINREIYVDPLQVAGDHGWHANMTDGEIDLMARTLVHENGHLLHGLPDEYNDERHCCGHSLMSQLTDRALDFCTWSRHDFEDIPPGCSAGGDDAWTRLWDDRGIPLPRNRFSQQLFPDPELYTTLPGKNGWPYSQFMTFNGL